MEKNKKNLIIASVLIVLFVLALFIGSKMFKSEQIIREIIREVYPDGNGRGASFSYTTGKVDQTEISTSSTTLVSLYNEESRDRIIDNVYYYFEDLNTTINEQEGDGLFIRGATTSIATGIFRVSASNTDYVLNSVIATSSKSSYGNSRFHSSSSPGKIGTRDKTLLDWVRVWPAGSYLNFVSNFVASSASGFIGVEYHSK